MNFQDKYVIDAEATFPQNKDKILISNEAFAIGEIIQVLVDKIEQARRDLR